MNKIKNNNIRKYIVSLMLILFTVILLDYFNIFSIVGINITNLNLDFLDIFINAFIIITLYLTTYYLINKREIKENNNKYKIALLLLENNYMECLKYIDLIELPDYKKDIFKKIDSSKPVYENEIYDNLINIPFSNESIILNFIASGIIDENITEKYFYIKREYKNYLAGFLIAYDFGKIVEDIIFQGRDNLIKFINNEILRINALKDK